MGTVPTTSIDETAPLGTDLVSQGDNEIRLYKLQNREILEVEHDYPSSGVATGRHKFPLSAETSIGGITDLVNGMLVVANDNNAVFARIAGTMTLVGSAGMMKGTLAARPVFGNAQRLYWASDEGIIYRDTGSAWEPIPCGAGSDSGKSVVLQDHFTDAPYVLDYGNTEISTKWQVETDGTQPDALDFNWSPLSTEPNGVLRGSADAGVADFGGSLQTWAPASALAQNPTVIVRARFTQSDDYQARFGLADNWTSIGGIRPTKGIFFERAYDEGVSDTLLGVVRGATDETVSLGAADAGWHTYEFVASGGNAVEFFYDDVSKGSVTGITLTDMLKLGFQLHSDDTSNDAYFDIDYCTVLSDALS